MTMRLTSLVFTLALLAGAQAACPFAKLAGGDALPSRRALLQNGCAEDPLVPPTPPQSEVDAIVKQALFDVIAPALNAPTVPWGGIVRATFHDAGTFNRRAGRGGANGSFRFEVALAPNSNNANLARANSLVNSWKASVDARLRADPKVPAGTRVSYADTLQAAGVLASIAAGGPTAEQLWKPFVVGRVDATRADADLNLLPGQNQRIAQLSCTYLTAGYTWGELVALSGAHSLGFNRGRPMTTTPNVLEGTDYYGLVASGRAAFISDNELIRSPNSLPWVQHFTISADPRGEFRKYYALAYLKMGMMGATFKSYPQ